jgi:hypothetical protein
VAAGGQDSWIFHSTVNNDVNHFNNSTFEPNYQEYRQRDEANGWWNPDGSGNFRLIDCKIGSITYKDGTGTSDSTIDPIIDMSICDTNDKVAGKIVDLDPQQQSVSELWGLIVRVFDGQKDIIKGNFEVASFHNLWMNRSTSQGGDIGASASYQSILKNLEWSEAIDNSRFLKELKKVSPELLHLILLNLPITCFPGISPGQQ